MRVLPFSLHPHVVAAFSGRDEGNQATHTGEDPARVGRSRAVLAAELSVQPERLRWLHQVHSARVVPAPSSGDDTPEADAMLDVSASLAPVILTADCLPVLFAARGAELETRLAAAHAGRRGLLAGVLTTTVQSLRAGGADRAEAWIGPAICGACYEVPADMREQAEAERPGIGALTSWGTASLDLPAAAEAELSALGVLVHRSGTCTLHDPGYFSYRAGDVSARNASVVVARSRP